MAARRARPDWKKNIAKLKVFTSKIGYKEAIFLIFGALHDEERLRAKVKELRLKGQHISVLWHKEPGEKPEVLRNKKEWAERQ